MSGECFGFCRVCFLKLSRPVYHDNTHVIPFSAISPELINLTVLMSSAYVTWVLMIIC